MAGGASVFLITFYLLIALILSTSHGLSPPGLSPSAFSHDAKISTPSYHYHTHFFTQTLDHFTFLPSSFQTFQQRYLLNTQHWAGSKQLAPIFVYCGNEGDITSFAENTGFLWDIAPLFKAMVVFLEHRYYGASIPDLALRNQSAETMGYLTAEQAIADYAVMILDLKKNFSSEESPVLFGGSYGGMLAAWFRLKYPHVAIGALASSAPILLFGDLVPWDGFVRTVSNDFKAASVSCFDTIKSSWDALKKAYKRRGGRESVAKKFHFCGGATTDLATVNDIMSSAWVVLAMTDYPYAADFVMPLPANPVKEVCKAMDSLPKGTDIISRIAAGMRVFYNGTCIDVSSGGGGSGYGSQYGSWDWQACTEMIFPSTSNPNNSMFPARSFDFKDNARACKAFVGVYPRPHWIIQEFGGHDIRTVLKRFASNIIFSNGLLDPWSSGGVLESISDSVVALVTKYGAHHLDLRGSTANDPPWLIHQRQQELQHIKRWLHYYYVDLQANHSL